MKKKKRNNPRKTDRSARAAVFCTVCAVILCLAALTACALIGSRTEEASDSITESTSDSAQSVTKTEEEKTSADDTSSADSEENTSSAVVTDTDSSESTAPSVTSETESEKPPVPKGGSEYLGKTSKGYDIERIDGVTYVGGILIANKTYPLPESYYPGGLTDETNRAFWAMQSAAAQEGISLWCKSGFRSYIDQKIIYNDYAARDGAALADTYSARPGHSEHQSGMALDLNSLSTSFGDTPEGKWLAANCWKYGFIIRYMKEKESITGYIYEPWHVRYIGKENAKAVTESGLCLEEYLGITSSYN